MSAAIDPRTTTATGTDVRVRFCPSPTGLPHVGMVRTALYNWAYARHTGGKLIFRVEDTDAARDSEESYRQLVDALTWLEIDWDEGVEKGGPHEPYRQSQRREIYAEVLEKLIASGAVYESYSTAEEIDARNEAAGRAKQLGYDNFDRDLTDEQKAAFRAEGREPAWRLRVPDHDLTYVDLIRGEVTFPAGSFPDFVVVRAGGQALYTFTNPVDDALMGITHVIRGEDLMPSTASARALRGAHRRRRHRLRAAIRSHAARAGETGNKKLSKRDPQADLFLLREKGFIHEGLLNYLALLGWSIAADRDVFSRDEFVAAFDIVDVNPNPPASTRRRPSRSTATTSACSRRGLRRAARSVSRRRRCRRESTDGAAAGDTGCRRAPRAGAHAAARRRAGAPRLPVPGRGLLRRRCRRGSSRERGRGARGIRGRPRARARARLHRCGRAGSPVARSSTVWASSRASPTAPARRRERSSRVAAAVRVDGAARQGESVRRLGALVEKIG
jgi:hypothetical protein